MNFYLELSINEFPAIDSTDDVIQRTKFPYYYRTRRSCCSDWYPEWRGMVVWIFQTTTEFQNYKVIDIEVLTNCMEKHNIGTSWTAELTSCIYPYSVGKTTGRFAWLIELLTVKITINIDPVHTVPDSRGHEIEFDQFTIIFLLTTVSMISCY